MIKTGIDRIAIYTPRYAYDLDSNQPGIAANSLGQITMSVPPPGEDIVTMAANAGLRVLRDDNIGSVRDEIAMLLLATESGIDQSKAAGIYVHHLLELSPHCRVVELKQACYSATMGLQLAMPFLRENPHKKVLLIATDIARYGLGSSGESSQGAGAVAMLLAAQPRIIAFESEYGVVCDDVMDFWRPNYCHEAHVDGKYSSKLYMTMLEKSYQHYVAQSARPIHAHQYFCYHTPVPRLVETAHYHLLKSNQTGMSVSKEDAAQQVSHSLNYARLIGNTYSASLYVSLASLLDLHPNNLAQQRIAFYSYGSGCVAEYFSGIVQEGYREVLNINDHHHLLNSRRKLSYADYAELYNFKYVEDGSSQTIPVFNTDAFALTRMENHKRIYQPTLAKTKTSCEQPHLKTDSRIKIHAPAKLILSGEHAVVYGAPALAMAIQCYTRATIHNESSAKTGDLHFNLTDLSHHARLTYATLKKFKEKIKNNYDRFKHGEFSIREVLQKPFELAHFALSMITETVHETVLNDVHIQIESDIPIGCGMGSSAATILCVLKALAMHLKLDMNQHQLFELALAAENMQHGASSGLDLQVALHGGCIYMNGNEPVKRSVPPFSKFPLYVINTGKPLTSTGQCVAHAAQHFKSNQLIEEFKQVTNAMDAALQQQVWSDLLSAMRHNHQLLVRIGVVPHKIQQMIAQIEHVGGAAKICGAGAIAGENGGAVFIAHLDQAVLEQVMEPFGFKITPVHCELKGLHAA